MKKLVVFLFFIFFLVGGYIFLFQQEKNYKLEYEKDGFYIIEEFDINKQSYFFEVRKEELVFHFMLPHKYSKKRKIVNLVKEEEVNRVNCITLTVFKEDLPSLCYDGKEYMDSYVALKDKNTENQKMNTNSNIDVYDDHFRYLLWDGYGIKDIIQNKEYHFLKKESYDNPLSYQFGNIILFADLDATREFSKFYLYDNEKQEIETWEFEEKISFDSYFMGEYENAIYLFDQKNVIQYKIDPFKKKIEVASDKEGALYYDKKITYLPLNKFQYNQLLFQYSLPYSFSLNANLLYMHFWELDDAIRISRQEVDSIIRIQDDSLYYLCDEYLYYYSFGAGEKILLKNFEWNFSYKNKIFIFD